LQCVVVCCIVLQCVAVCCSVLQCAAVRCSVLQCAAVCRSVLQCAAVCCSALRCVAVQCVAECSLVGNGKSTPPLFDSCLHTFRVVSSATARSSCRCRRDYSRQVLLPLPTRLLAASPLAAVADETTLAASPLAVADETTWNVCHTNKCVMSHT